MKNKYLAVTLLLTFVFASCGNDPIFYTLQEEVKPKDAKIKGSPSKIVSDSTSLYVANGSAIWKWSPDSWTKFSTPSSNIRDVAYVEEGANSGLYALSVGDDSSTVWRYNDTWQKLPSAGFIQIIYGAKDTLFATGRDSNNTYTAYLWNGASFTPVAFSDQNNSNRQIYGATYFDGKYYLATDAAVYSAAGSSDAFNLVKSEKWTTEGKSEWMGIAAYNNFIIAVSRNGHVYFKDTLNPDSEKVTNPESSYKFTGAVCFWHDFDEENPRVYALIGIRSTSYTYGYREFGISAGVLDSYGTPQTVSVEDGNKYASTIGTHALSSIIQAPNDTKASDGRPLFFASTQQSGLWSYRKVWNAEE